jgi:RNA polymerase sigma factor (sigma-70 family)
MPEKQPSAVLRHIRRLVLMPAAPDTTDSQLLERFVLRREQEAFAELVRRHEAMVWGVCRRVLRNHADAEDAFQAAFCVLACKASSIRKRASIGAWLYLVSYNIALKARLNAKRQQILDRQAAIRCPADPQAEATEREVWALLDEELCRLPEKFRAPLVLCYLEGRTHAQAAQELGYRPGSISWRLARGQQLLRRRLVRRGLTLSAGMLSALLLRESTVARAACLVGCVSEAALIRSISCSGTGGALSANVVLLTKGALHAMWITKVRMAAALVLAVSVISAGGGLAAYRALAAAPQDSASQATPASPNNRQDDELKKALARIAVLEKQLAEQGHAGGQKSDSIPALPPETGPRRRMTSEAEQRLQADAVQRMEDEVEVLQAEVDAKQAEVHATEISLAAVNDELKQAEANKSTPRFNLLMMRQDVANREAQFLVKRAELKQSQVRLRQAQRRLALLQGPKEPQPEAKPSSLEQRVQELEEKVRRMDHDLARLKRAAGSE